MMQIAGFLEQRRGKLPVALQTESSECGLACLVMIAGFYGNNTDISAERRENPISLKGANLNQLIRLAARMGLASRPVKVELEDLQHLRMPCILHWNMDHFVVLKSVSPGAVTIHDPSFGVRKLPLGEVSGSYTGVALEVWPNVNFKAKDAQGEIKLLELLGNHQGLLTTFTQLMVLALALELFALINPFFLQTIVDTVVAVQDQGLLSVFAVGFGISVAIQQILYAVRGWAIIRLSALVGMQWKSSVFSHLLHLPVQYFERRHLGDVLSRFGSIDQIQNTLTGTFIEALLDGVVILITLVVLALYSLPLACVSVAATMLYFLLRQLAYHPLKNASEEQLVRAARQQGQLLESVRGVRTIKLFLRETECHSVWLNLLGHQVGSELRVNRLHLMFRVASNLILGLESVVVLWLGASLVMAASLTVGMLVAFLALKAQFVGRATSMVDRVFDLRMLRLMGERLSDIVLAEPEPVFELGGEASPQEMSIELKGVSFRYAEQEPLVLQNVSFSIRDGESVAITGPSGCGKTTLLNLIVGILTPTGGDILLGGRSLRALGAGQIRNISAVVLQDDVLFAGSIGENISFFDAAPDWAWIETCARDAAIWDDISRMPMRLQTLVGDMGTVLSGGQKQRVLLARALYRRPKILFLDEATSHLDIETERLVSQAIRRQNITRVIIAHRPETIASADRVIDMSGFVQ